MNSPIDPMAQDVRALGDVLLRELLIRLCEAELAVAGRPASDLRTGGDQNAADGGLDLFVGGSGPPLPFLPAFPAGIQVKAEAMGPAKVTAEMRPAGALRPVLQELAVQRGAYIIASGTDNCTHARLVDRQRAMAEAMTGAPDAEHLKLDFYDADALARWTRSHAGVALWLADQVGLPILGWRAFGPWSATATAATAPFLSDDLARVYFGLRSQPDTVKVALAKLRSVLGAPGAVARLVGLSGMGKTRLAQALFEAGIAGAPLDASFAVYGDAGTTLRASPEEMSARLAASARRAVLIVDNCEAGLHRRLAEIVRRPGSQVSLLTVDFDVGDDEPPETSVVRLEPASTELIVQLLAARFPSLDFNDRQRIADFAGGNARIALALAASGDGGNLAQLRDRELLDRLFLNDRRTPDEALRRVARAASLVNAFDVEVDGADAEMPVLAALANVDVFTFHGKLADLLERGLAQQRGVQRAVLPQALALRLADEAFARLPPPLIWASVVEGSPARLRKSFTRRIGLLHETPGAVAIAERLLAPGGAINLANLADTDTCEMFANLAPLAPAPALDRIVEAVAAADPDNADFRWSARERIGRLLIALAFDAERFEPAILALVALMTRLRVDPRDQQFKAAFLAFFQAASSGTLSEPSARFALIDTLLASSDASVRELGLEALLSSLRTRMENPHLQTAFGARARSSGWRPGDDPAWIAWFGRALDAYQTQLSAGAIPRHLQAAFAQRLVEMLRFDVLRPLAESAIRSIAARCFWRDGWFAICTQLNRTRLRKQEPVAEVERLEADLRPTSLEDRFVAWVLGDSNAWHDPAVADHKDWDHFIDHGRALGRDIAARAAERSAFVLRAASNPQARGYALGEGLAEACDDPDIVWEELRGAAADLGAEAANPTVLTGFLSGASKRWTDRVERWLATAATDPVLSTWIVDLHLAVGPLDAARGARLLDGLANGTAAPATFAKLMYGRLTHSLPNPLLAQIIQQLIATPGGLDPAVSVLHMRYFGASEVVLDDTLLEAGRHLLMALADDAEGGLGGGDVTLIATACLVGHAGEVTAATLARRLLLANAATLRQEIAPLAALLLERYPVIALDIFLGGNREPESYALDWLLGGGNDDDSVDGRPLAAVADVALQAWVGDNAGRAQRLAEYVPYFNTPAGGVPSWTPMALWLIERPGLERIILETFEQRFHVGSWSGEVTSRYERRLVLAQDLLDHPNSEIAGSARALEAKLKTWIDEMRRQERDGSQRFE